MDPASQNQIRAARHLQCSSCGVMFGVFLCFPGITLTSMGNAFSDWGEDTSLSVMRVIGPILLVTGLILVIVGIVSCIHLRKNLPQAAATNTPVVSGMAPGGATYPPVCGATYPPVGVATYPPVGVALQPVPGHYPPQPGQMGYQQQPGYPQPFLPQAGYPPQPTAPPVYGQNMGYPSDSAGVPDVPPPSYEEIKK